MKLSRNAIQILKWMNRNDEPKYPHQIETGCKGFEPRAFSALESAGLIAQCESYDVIPDYDIYGNDYTQYEYQITDAGKALLETRVFAWLPELNDWLSLAVSAVSLVLSIIALLKK